MKKKSSLIIFHVPKDQATLAAIGTITLRHEHMNYALRMVIKSLAGVTPAEALRATDRESSSSLRERTKKLARKRLGEGASLIKLQAMLGVCAALSDKRNKLVHGIWAHKVGGDAHIRIGTDEMLDMPSAKELLKFGNEIKQHTDLINRERLEGWLFDALQASPS